MSTRGICMQMTCCSGLPAHARLHTAVLDMRHAAVHKTCSDRALCSRPLGWRSMPVPQRASRSSNMQSLETAARRDAVSRQNKSWTLLQRSCVAIGAVLVVIAVIGFLPTRNSSPVTVETTSSSKPKGEDVNLRHVLQLNRHGALLSEAIEAQPTPHHCWRLASPRSCLPWLANMQMRAGARSTVSWYDFEGGWAWADDDVAQGKLTVRGMQQVCPPIFRHIISVSAAPSCMAQAYDKHARQSQVCAFETNRSRGQGGRRTALMHSRAIQWVCRQACRHTTTTSRRCEACVLAGVSPGPRAA